MLMLARTREELEAAIRHAQMVPGLPPQALAMAREQLLRLQEGGEENNALQQQMQECAFGAGPESWKGVRRMRRWRASGICNRRRN